MTPSYGPLQAIQLLSKTFLSKVHSLWNIQPFRNFFPSLYMYIHTQCRKKIYVVSHDLIELQWEIKNFKIYFFCLAKNYTCDITGGSDGNVKLAKRSLTEGNSEHSDWFAPYSANLFNCMDAAVIAGLRSLLSANCVTFVVTSYTNGNTKDVSPGYDIPILVSCNCEIM